MQIVADQENIVREKTAIVGMGNYFRNDDAAGLLVMDAIKNDRIRSNVHLVNVEDVLESYIFAIAGSDSQNIVLLDAVSCQAEPGSIVFGPLPEMSEKAETLSTHKAGLKLAEKILAGNGKKTWLLGIVAGNTDYGNQVSPEVRKGANIIINMLKDIIKE